MMNIVIPMAGRGSRFADAGYTLPKPLIPVRDMPMIEVVANNLRPADEHRFIFIALAEHIEKYGLTEKLSAISPGCAIIPVSTVTEGAACTVLLAEEYIDNGDPLMIANSDQYVDVDINDYLKAGKGADGLIMTMTADDNRWSYIRADEGGSVVEVREKEVISNEATVGIYNLARGADFVSGAKEMISRNIRTNGEFYVAPVYNMLAARGMKFTYRNVGALGNGMYGLGVPEDLEAFVKLDICTKALSQESTASDYIHMQKRYYENPEIESKRIVGNFEWHEQYPYETFLLYKFGDIRTPVLNDFGGKRALDFGCGPGRMIKRMRKYFAQVDGCDISERLLAEAKENNPESKFFLAKGNNLGDVPDDSYDFVYCTISMQHIASHSIRMEIIKHMKRTLRPGGAITLQMAYHPEFPDGSQFKTGGKYTLSRYLSDDFWAKQTNGRHDVGVGKDDLPQLRTDFETLFADVAIWFSNVGNYYDNLRCFRHSPYWASDWIYINAYKKKD